MNVLEHLPNLNNVFEEIDRILKIKGTTLDPPFLCKYMVLLSTTKIYERFFL